MLCFLGNGDNKSSPKNPRHFSMPNPQASSKKESTAGKVTLQTEKKYFELIWHVRADTDMQIQKTIIFELFPL